MIKCYVCGNDRESVRAWGEPCNYCERRGWLDWAGMPESQWTDPYGEPLHV
jgi:hypothetical protein